MKFSGTTTECLLDFGQRDTEGNEGRKLLARFAGVVEHPTAREWLSGQRQPLGETLLKVRCFLYLAGYQVSEFEAVPKVARKLALLIATDLVVLDDVQDELGYKNRDGVFSTILRGKSPMRDKVFRMERLVNTHHEDLSQEVNSWRDQILQLHISDRPTPVEAAVTEEPASPFTEETVTQQPAVVDTDSPRRRRIRNRHVADRQSSDSSLGSARTLAHLVQAMDELINSTDQAELASLLRDRVAPHRREMVRDFLSSTL